MTAAVTAWLGLLLGLTGMGAVFAFIVRFIGSWRGGLR